MDYQEKYRKNVEEEQEQGKNNRAKREEKKKAEKLKIQLEIDKLRESSTGLITWKRKDNLLIWDGYVDEKKYFRISHGIYKYSLSIYLESGIKDKSPKTSFELQKLQLKAESMLKQIIVKIKDEEK